MTSAMRAAAVHRAPEVVDTGSARPAGCGGEGGSSLQGELGCLRHRTSIDDGDVLTSAGVAAGIDLCLHILRRDHGAAVATDVARRSVVPPHRDDRQAQYIRRPVPEPQRATTAAARAWALELLEQPIRLRDMAGRGSMSVRTFTRRFREETGVSPLQWLVRQRVECARQLLEETDLPVDRIAADAGSAPRPPCASTSRRPWASPSRPTGALSVPDPGVDHRPRPPMGTAGVAGSTRPRTRVEPVEEASGARDRRNAPARVEPVLPHHAHGHEREPRTHAHEDGGRGLS